MYQLDANCLPQVDTSSLLTPPLLRSLVSLGPVRSQWTRLIFVWGFQCREFVVFLPPISQHYRCERNLLEVFVSPNFTYKISTLRRHIGKFCPLGFLSSAVSPSSVSVGSDVLRLPQLIWYFPGFATLSFLPRRLLTAALLNKCLLA